MIQNCLDPNVFMNQFFSRPRLLLDPNVFWDSNVFWDPNFLLCKIFYGFPCCSTDRTDKRTLTDVYNFCQTPTQLGTQLNLNWSKLELTLFSNVTRTRRTRTRTRRTTPPNFMLRKESIGLNRTLNST